MKHEIKLKPWIVPNFATVDVDENEAMQRLSIPVHQLSDETLEAMCKQFRDAVFAKKHDRATAERILGAQSRPS